MPTRSNQKKHPTQFKEIFIAIFVIAISAATIIFINMK